MERLVESFKIAVSSIWLNLMRSMLTMLGIIIGIASVVVLVSLGRGVEDFVVSQFQDLGVDLLTVNAQAPEDELFTHVEPLTMRDVEAFSDPRIAPHIQEVGAQYSVRNKWIAASGESESVTIEGITPNMLALQNREIANGAGFTDAHINEQARVAILGSEIAQTLFGTDNPIGQFVRIEQQTFEVVAVLEELGSGTGTADSAVMVPLSTAQMRLSDARANGSYTVNLIYARAIDRESISLAEADMHRYLEAAHNITAEEQRDYHITNQEGLLDSVGQVLGMLTIFLGLIAGISLLVGGIGIMNIMLVTVTERTREIGLRKAVGAEPADILSQFLFESILLSLAGGILGLLFAWLCTVLVSIAFPDLVLGIQLDAVVIATVIASMVGIIFGLLPARQAALMKPIDALRYE
jgi:putative ABC transport system permease protein